MNRIVIVGNGFDLAHDYKTSYKDFIEWYWEQWKNTLLKSSKRFVADDLCSFKLKIDIYSFYDAFTFDSELSVIGSTHNPMFSPRTENNPNAFEFITQLMHTRNCVEVKICPLLCEIQNRIDNSTWVDIETLYYDILCSKIVIKDYFNHPEVLNKDLDSLRLKLVEYLTIEASTANTTLKDSIRYKLYRNIEERDIAVRSGEAWRNLVDKRSKMNRESWMLLLKKYYIDNPEFYIAINDALQQAQKIIDSKPLVPVITNPDFSRPDKVILLNFNYTQIADIYLYKHYNFITNHIHGVIGEPDKVIFGYGDEIDSGFEDLKRLNNNHYLQNMKTIKYLESSKYRDILKIMEEDTFQVYIMGHSCGNSDRTLLNTIFEHKNCVSIKPFYYIDKNGRDNYIDIVQNISRCFTDMQLMRDRVVNKEFCEVLA